MPAACKAVFAPYLKTIQFMEETVTHSILFVDDDTTLLKSFKRTLGTPFKITTADSPEKGLHILQEQGQFSVVVSDMKMPGMSGIEMLTRAKEISPDTSRILLTGYADQQTAIDGVNKGNLFRFLTKPCDIETLTQVLHAAVREHQLIGAEKELLEQTLLGTVRVLSQILTLVNPTAQGCASRTKRYVRHITAFLSLREDGWLYEMAAILSQLGCLTIPPEVLLRHSTGAGLSGPERKMMEQHPSTAAKFLAKIPRMEEVIEIIAGQNKPYSQFPKYSDPESYAKVYLGAQILHVAIDLDRLLRVGMSPDKILKTMQQETEEYNPVLVESLRNFDFGLQNMVHMSIHCNKLTTRMILDEEIRTSTGMLLASKGQKVTQAILMGILNYSQTIGINEPFMVLVPLFDYEI